MTKKLIKKKKNKLIEDAATEEGRESDQSEEEAEEEEEALESDEEVEFASDASTDSVPDDPEKSEQAYKIAFRRVVSKYLPEQWERFEKEGSKTFRDFKAFTTNCERIRSKAVDEFETSKARRALHIHVICLQVAKNYGLQDGSAWEETKALRPFYDSGIFKRVGKQKVSVERPESTSSQDEDEVVEIKTIPNEEESEDELMKPRRKEPVRTFEKMAEQSKKVSLTLSDSEESESESESEAFDQSDDEETEEKTFLVYDILKEWGIDKFEDVAKEAENLVAAMWQSDRTKPSLYYSNSKVVQDDTYAYPDTDENREFVRHYILFTLLKMVQKIQEKEGNNDEEVKLRLIQKKKKNSDKKSKRTREKETTLVPSKKHRRTETDNDSQGSTRDTRTSRTLESFNSSAGGFHGYGYGSSSSSSGEGGYSGTKSDLVPFEDATGEDRVIWSDVFKHAGADQIKETICENFEQERKFDEDMRKTAVRSFFRKRKGIKLNKTPEGYNIYPAKYKAEMLKCAEEFLQDVRKQYKL